jgi:CubicO group peptidase (beta-lactamase class C family)
VTAWNGSQGWAGGGINSTAEDMAKYTAGLTSGALFQDPDSLEQMLSFDGQIFPFLGGYGLGVGQWTADPNPVAWGHGGQTAGFETIWAVYPELDSQVILFTNSGSCHVSAFIDVLNASPELFTQELS